MPRNSSGVYSAPANTAAVSGQTISSTANNTLETDIGTEITNSLDRGGRSAMTAALPMGNQKITGMADPTVPTDATTKNYVDTSVAAFFSTGDGKITLKTAADSGWILCDDGTFGSATSGSSNRANVDTLALFTLFFNNISDTAAPILTSGGGATTRAGQTNAATAWAANCRMTLTKQLGRAIAIAGTGAGLTARPLGSSVGTETVIISQANLPSVNLNVTTAIITVISRLQSFFANTGSSIGLDNLQNTGGGGTSSATYTTTAQTAALGGSGTALSVMQPETFWNVMIKL